MTYGPYNIANIKIRCFEIMFKKFASQMDAELKKFE